MAAHSYSMRCTQCGIDYPPHIDNCPVCASPTWLNNKVPPDDLWEWRATKLKKDLEDAARGAVTQPYWFDIPVVEVIHDKEGQENDLRAELEAAPCVSVTDVYAFMNRRQLLKPDDIIEIPDRETGGSNLYEVMGSFRSGPVAMYMLRRMTVPDYVPLEWL